MDPSERIQAAVKLKPPPRGERQVPVAPLIITFAGRAAGITQAQIFSSPKLWQQALQRTYERIGPCDLGFAIWPRDIPFSEAMKFKLPGRELPEDELFQLVEEPVMQRKDYALLVKQGYRRWFLDYNLRLQPNLSRGLLGRAAISRQFTQMGERIRSNVKALQALGIPPAFTAACYPAFDFFSLARSVGQFSLDLYDCPQAVQKACAASTESIINATRQTLRLTGGKQVCIYPMRSSATFISPAMFERFALPYLVQMVEAFVKDGLTPILHCDADWTPMLHFFRELPQAKCILELDGDTDIAKAKVALADWMCLKGDVPAGLLAFGQPDEVRFYCEELIQEVGSEGGFILSSGCEVPLNARIENLMAMIEVGRSSPSPHDYRPGHH